MDPLRSSKASGERARIHHGRDPIRFLRYRVADLRARTGLDHGDQSDLGLIDRKGTVEPLKLPSGRLPTSSRLSERHPDRLCHGRWQGVDRLDLRLGRHDVNGQLTLGGKNRFPIWTADGQRVAFQSDREGDLGIFWQRADGSDAAQRLTKPDRALPTCRSRGRRRSSGSCSE